MSQQANELRDLRRSVATSQAGSAAPLLQASSPTTTGLSPLPTEISEINDFNMLLSDALRSTQNLNPLQQPPGQPVLSPIHNQDETFQGVQQSATPARESFERNELRWADGNLTGMAAFDSTPLHNNANQLQPLAASSSNTAPNVSAPPRSTASSEAPNIRLQPPEVPLLSRTPSQQAAYEAAVQQDREMLEESIRLEIYSELKDELDKKYRLEFQDALDKAKQELTRMDRESEAVLKAEDEAHRKLDPITQKFENGKKFQNRADERAKSMLKDRFGVLNSSLTMPPPRATSLMTAAATAAADEHRKSIHESEGGTNVVYTPMTFRHPTMGAQDLTLWHVKQFLDKTIMHKSQTGNKDVCCLQFYEPPVRELLVARHNETKQSLVRRQEYGYTEQASEMTTSVAMYKSGADFENFMKVALCPHTAKESEHSQMAMLRAIDSKHGLVPDNHNRLPAYLIGPFILAQREKIRYLLVWNSCYPQFSQHSVDGKQVQNSNCTGVRPNTRLGTSGVIGMFMQTPGWGPPPPRGPPDPQAPLARPTLREVIETKLSVTGTGCTSKQNDDIVYTIGRLDVIFSAWTYTRKETSHAESTFLSVEGYQHAQHGPPGLIGNIADPMALKFTSGTQPKLLRDASSRAATTESSPYKRKSTTIDEGLTTAPAYRSRRLSALDDNSQEPDGMDGDAFARLNNVRLRDSYERDHGHNPNSPNGLFYNSDGEAEDELERDRGAHGSDENTLRYGDHYDEYDEPDTSYRSLYEAEDSHYAQESGRKDFGSSDHRDGVQRLSNLDGRGELRGGQDSRLKYALVPNAHGGRPPDSRDRGRSQDPRDRNARDSRDAARRPDSRHDPNFPRGDAGKLADTSSRSKSPERIKWESQQPCHGAMSELGCKNEQVRGECQYSHDEDKLLTEYKKFRKVMEPLRLKDEQGSRQMVTTQSQSAPKVVPKSSLQVMKRGPEQKAVSFEGRQLAHAARQAEQQHAHAEWYSNQLYALHAEYQGRRQHVDDERRPTERVEETLDDYQSSGYSSTDDS